MAFLALEKTVTFCVHIIQPLLILRFGKGKIGSWNDRKVLISPILHYWKRKSCHRSFAVNMAHDEDFVPLHELEQGTNCPMVELEHFQGSQSQDRY